MDTSTTDGPTGTRRDGASVLLVSAAAVLATIVLIGWFAPVEVLTDFGFPARTTPWSAVSLSAIVVATGLPVRARRAALGLAVAMQACVLIAPQAAITLQEALVGVSQVSSPGTASVVLLLAMAAIIRESSPATSAALLVASCSIAGLAVTGAFAGWSWAVSAGALSTGAGMAVPTVIFIVLAVASVMRSDSNGLVSALGGLPWATLGAAAAVPWLALAVTRDVGRTAYLFVVAATALVALITSRTTAAGGSADALVAIDAAMQPAPDAMVIVSEDGTIVRCNPAMAVLSGYDLGHLHGAAVDALVPEVSRQGHAHRRDAFVDEGHARHMASGVATEMLRADGTTLPVDIALAPIRVGRTTLVLATVRDTSDRTRAEATVVRLEEMRQLFLSSVSHELRSPLAVMVGVASILTKYGDNLDRETRDSLHQRISNAGGRLERLLGDLLDVQSLDNDTRVMIAPVDVAEVVGAALAHGPHAPGDVSVVVTRGTPSVLANRSLMERAVHNLLTNAHTYAPGPLEVRIGPGDDGGVLLAVEDHGAGVPEELRATVFTPFARGVAVNAATPGVGIGLSLVAGFASTAGGRAWADDRDDGLAGASMRIWLRAVVEDSDGSAGDNGVVAMRAPSDGTSAGAAD